MKIFFTGLYLISLFAGSGNNSLLFASVNEKENCVECRVKLPLKKNQTDEFKLSSLPQSTNFCTEKELQLRREIKILNEKFLKYKEEKEKEIEALEIVLNAYEKRNLLLSNRDVDYKREGDINIFPSTERSSWAEIIVDGDLDIYDLALKYYGAYEEYYVIYRANKDVLGNSTVLYKGMLLRLPINEKFRDHPLTINIK